MLTSGRTRPYRTHAPPGRMPEPPPRPPRAVRPSRPQVSYERVFGIGILASALFHLLLFVLFPDLVRIGVMPGGAAAPEERVLARNEIQLLNPVASESAPEVPVEEAAPPTPDRPVPARPPPAAPRPGPPAAAPTETPAAAGPGSARDALRPGFRDSRLYVAPQEIVPDRRTDHERYMEHLQARVDALNDSIQSGLPVTDWTVTDRDGKRWGLSPEGLHLGGVTVPRALLPLPAATGDNAQLERAREQQRQRDEIQRQEAERERRETREERIRATRERQEAERRRRGGGG
jgi:hypothetical protein